MSQPPDVGALRLNDDVEDEYDNIPYEDEDIDYDMDIDLGPTPSKPSAPRPETSESREAALRKELDSVRQINKVIEDVVQSLEKAKGNMDVCYFCSYFKNTSVDTLRTSIAQCTRPRLFLTHGRAFSPRPNTINAYFSTRTGKEQHKISKTWKTNHSYDNNKPKDAPPKTRPEEKPHKDALRKRNGKRLPHHRQLVARDSGAESEQHRVA